MTEILALATAVAVLVVGFLEVVKITFKIDKRFLPITAVIVGAVVGCLAYFLDASLADRIWAGAIAGLMATGIFEAGKQVVKGDK